MVALANPKQEAFAQALARGETANDAARAAGYSPDTGWTRELRQKPHCVKRVAELAETAEWGATRDLAPVINALMRAAEKSAKMDSAAAMKVTGELLSKIAELKLLLPTPTPTPASIADRPFATLSPEEWSRRYPPRG